MDCSNDLAPMPGRACLRRLSRPPRRLRGTGFTLLALVAIGLSVASIGADTAPAPTLDGYEHFVDEDGQLAFSPAKLRRLVHLGSWFVPEGDAAGFHHVYTQQAAIDHFRRTGRFPDGTALVKEIVRARRANYTTGVDVASATTTQQWFLMIKDTRGRFPGNPLWGDGWGWGLFGSDAPTTNVATDFKIDCLGCHVPAQRTDWVYVEGYPALHDAAGAP
jgi:hypothetical protein